MAVPRGDGRMRSRRNGSIIFNIGVGVWIHGRGVDGDGRGPRPPGGHCGIIVECLSHLDTGGDQITANMLLLYRTVGSVLLSGRDRAGRLCRIEVWKRKGKQKMPQESVCVCVCVCVVWCGVVLLKGVELGTVCARGYSTAAIRRVRNIEMLQLPKRVHRRGLQRDAGLMQYAPHLAGLSHIAKATLDRNATGLYRPQPIMQWVIWGDPSCRWYGTTAH